MTTITTHGTHATLVNVFTVEPSRARALADLLTAATETVMCHLEGFRSANIHVSLDQTRVVNYAQWESKEMYLKMLSDPVAQQHMRKAAGLATSFDPNLYTVESVHERA